MDVWQSIEENVIIVKAGIIFLRLSGTIKSGVPGGHYTLGTFPEQVFKQYTLWDYSDPRVGGYYTPGFTIKYYKNGDWVKYSCTVSTDGKGVRAWIGNNGATEFYMIGTVRHC